MATVRRLIEDEPRPLEAASAHWVSQALSIAVAVTNLQTSDEDCRASLETFRLLVHAGAWVNLEPGIGLGPPLHLAVQHPRVEAAEMLLDRGADPNQIDPRCAVAAPPGTPLALAIHEPMRSLLRRYGAVR